MLLDHESTQMTAHYARITDQTVRRRWEQATKVNITTVTCSGTDTRNPAVSFTDDL